MPVPYWRTEQPHASTLLENLKSSAQYLAKNTLLENLTIPGQYLTGELKNLMPVPYWGTLLGNLRVP